MGLFGKKTMTRQNATNVI